MDNNNSIDFNFGKKINKNVSVVKKITNYD